MKLLGISSIAIFLSVVTGSTLPAQTFAPTPTMTPADSSQLQTLIKKLDEQNAKIDTLSQQILKLEQQLTSTRPGVMVGEATPASTSAPMPATAPAANVASAAASPAPNGGNTHTVARGETLTSIAKMYSVSVTDLQKFNHIENDRKLQIGQTIMVPGSPAPSPPASSSP